MLYRFLSAALGLFQSGLGLTMILTPRAWFFAAPCIAATGPFNAHFVIDAGLGFVAAGMAFLALAWQPRLRLLALGASGFVTFHALFHLTHLAMGMSAAPGVDIGLAIPAALGLALSWPRTEHAA